MIISPWVLGFSDISLAKWCNILLGLLLVLVNAWVIFGALSLQEVVSEESITHTEKKKIKNNQK
jgi:hypothetical protein